jgi:hypothetical protein
MWPLTVAFNSFPLNFKFFLKKKKREEEETKAERMYRGLKN